MFQNVQKIRLGGVNVIEQARLAARHGVDFIASRRHKEEALWNCRVHFNDLSGLILGATLGETMEDLDLKWERADWNQIRITNPDNLVGNASHVVKLGVSLLDMCHPTRGMPETGPEFVDLTGTLELGSHVLHLWTDGRVYQSPINQ